MAEVEDDTKTEIAEVISDRDAVNEDVRAAITSLKGEEAPEVVADAPAPAADGDAPVTKPDHPTDPARYADGTFKSAKTDAAPAKAAAPDPKLPAPEDLTKASAPQPSTAALAPPVSWAADAKAAWASIPPAVQQAVLKREREASDGIGQYSERTKAYERALAPVAQEAQRRGLSVEDGIQRLLDGERFLSQQPAQAILWLAQKHGLDLAELASNPPAPQQPVRSEAYVPPQVIQQVSSLEERLNGILMDQNMSAVQAFAAQPENAYYADVEAQLPDVMRELLAANPSLRGVALLQAAYERAVWLNPDVRARLIADQHAQTAQAITARIEKKASQAQRAAVSVKGSAADTRPPPKPVNGAGTAFDDVRAAIAQLRAG